MGVDERPEFARQREPVQARVGRWKIGYRGRAAGKAKCYELVLRRKIPLGNSFKPNLLAGAENGRPVRKFIRVGRHVIRRRRNRRRRRLVRVSVDAATIIVKRAPTGSHTRLDHRIRVLWRMTTLRRVGPAGDPLRDLAQASNQFRVVAVFRIIRRPAKIPLRSGGRAYPSGGPNALNDGPVGLVYVLRGVCRLLICVAGEDNEAVRVDAALHCFILMVVRTDEAGHDDHARRNRSPYHRRQDWAQRRQSSCLQ